MTFIDIVFTAPPGGPDDPPTVFVEVEDDQGRGINYGDGWSGMTATGYCPSHNRRLVSGCA